jgi:hypothetical protein
MKKLLMAAMSLLFGAASMMPAAPKPTPTPTPRRLAGGFGKGTADAVLTPAPAGAETAVAGQSLADAVRAARQTRKKREAKSPLAITNDTLVTDPTKGRLTTSAPQPTSPAPTAEPEGPHPTPAGGDDSSAESYWRERMHSARTRVEELTERVRRFEQESRKLENDFYSWDDGQYRDGVIKPAWDKKREELETARRDLEQAQKELSELPEKARRAGAQPGWLRE